MKKTNEKMETNVPIKTIRFEGEVLRIISV
jgi:hypothetical protein